MDTLKDVLIHLLGKYPHKNELSNARVTKMVYLADWHHSIQHGRQITSVDWVFDNYGPFVWDIQDTANSHPEVFRIEQTMNMYGGSKTILSLSAKDSESELSDTAIKSIDHTIESSKSLFWGDFIQLIYSTYPIVKSKRYSQLDLVALASEYKDSRRSSS